MPGAGGGGGSVFVSEDGNDLAKSFFEQLVGFARAFRTAGRDGVEKRKVGRRKNTSIAQLRFHFFAVHIIFVSEI